MGAVLLATVYGSTKEEVEANARLFAEAPALLTMLTEAGQHIESEGDEKSPEEMELIDRIDDVIMRAEGGAA